MKNLIYILFVLLSFSAYSQRTANRFMTLKCQIQQVGISSGKPHISCNCIDLGGTWDATNVAVGDSLFFVDSGQGYKIPIDSIVTLGSPTIVVRGDWSGLGLVMIPTGNGAISRGAVNGNDVDIEGMTDGDKQVYKEDNVSNLSNSISDIEFNSDRSILRVPSVSTNIGGATVEDWLEWWYFSAPTITLNLSPTTTVYEVGTSNAITLSGATTNPGAATLTAGILQATYPVSGTINTFGSSTSYSQGITFTPQQGGSGNYNEFEFRFRAQQDWSGAGESGTATSPTRTIYGAYPILYGMSAVDLSVGGNPYTELTKLYSGANLQTEGNRSVVYSGTNEYMYYAMPKTWGDFILTEILDNSGFGSITGWTAYDITVTSSGLTNNWTQDYKLYKLNTLTTADPPLNYTFVR